MCACYLVGEAVCGCLFVGSAVCGLFVYQGARSAACSFVRDAVCGPFVRRDAARARDGNSYNLWLRMSSPRPAPMRTSARCPGRISLLTPSVALRRKV